MLAFKESYLFSDTIENNIGFAIDKPNPSLVVEMAKKADVHKNIEEFKEQYLQYYQQVNCYIGKRTGFK